MCNQKELIFESYKNCLEAIQLDNKMHYLEKHEINVDSLKREHKQFVKKSNKSILKTQQRFENERHNFFAEKINKIALSSNDDKRTQSSDSKETYVYGTSENLVSEKEEIKFNNIIKQYKND